MHCAKKRRTSDALQISFFKFLHLFLEFLCDEPEVLQAFMDKHGGLDMLLTVVQKRDEQKVALDWLKEILSVISLSQTQKQSLVRVMKKMECEDLLAQLSL